MAKRKFKLPLIPYINIGAGIIAITDSDFNEVVHWAGFDSSSLEKIGDRADLCRKLVTAFNEKYHKPSSPRSPVKQS